MEADEGCSQGAELGISSPNFEILASKDREFPVNTQKVGLERSNSPRF
jgi:hypothetical protein